MVLNCEQTAKNEPFTMEGKSLEDTNQMYDLKASHDGIRLGSPEVTRVTCLIRSTLASSYITSFESSMNDVSTLPSNKDSSRRRFISS